MTDTKSQMGEFLRKASNDEIYRGDTSACPYVQSTLADAFKHAAEVQHIMTQACEELYRNNMDLLKTIMEQGQNIYDGYGTLIYQTTDPKLVLEVLAAMNERHFGMSLTGVRNPAP